MIAITKRGLSLLLLGLLHVVVPATAIYESQAGTFDWHHTWVGHPHEAVKIDNDHIAVYTEKNIIASLNTHSGAVEWRQILENELDHFVATDAGILTVSSLPERAQFWNQTNGQLIWEYTLSESEIFGAAKPIAWNNGESVVSIGNTKLVKLSKEGEELWSWTRESTGDSMNESIQVLQRGNDIYVVVEPIEDSKSPVFAVNILDSATGETTKTVQIPCHTNYDHVAYVGNYIFWTEANLLKWSSIDKKDVKSILLKTLVDSLPTADKFDPTQINILGDSDDANTKSFILSAQFETDEGSEVASVLVNIEEKALVLSTYFGSQTTFGGLDFYESSLIRSVRSSSNEFTTSILPQGKDITIQQDFSLSGEINYVKLINLEPLALFVVTEGSSVLFYNESGLVWSREESLSNIAATEFLELPEPKMWTQMVDELDETVSEQANENPLSRYIRRLTTHVLETRKFPGWIISHIIGMSGSTLKDEENAVSTLEAQSCWLNQSKPEMLYRDNFGLRKLLISATKSGKIVAQDTSRNGKIIWSRYVDSFSFTNVYVVRAAAVKLPPVIVAIGDTYDDVGGQATGFLRINALTGENYVSTSPESLEFFEPVVATNIGTDKIMRLPIEDPEERTHMLAIYEAGSGRVYIYPDSFAAREKFAAEFLPNFYFSHQNKHGNLQGFKVVEGYRGSLKVLPVWEFKLPEGENALTMSKPQANEKVASIGRALGNRNVLYKYLNPHMFALITRGSAKGVMKVRIMDSVKGSILYETVHTQVDTETNEVHVIQSENWFIYHFWSNSAQPMGYQTVVLELFEGENENERVKSSNFSSFDNIQPHVLSSAFAFPYPVTTMGVTETRNGISTKNILFGLPTHQIMGVNKRMFDPRRPKEKPSKEDQEEMLIPYGPIPDEKRLFLTYGLDVAGVKSIISSPSLLESTALVFASGLDTFFTRSSPSKQFDVLSEDFSKAQLLLTITGLIVGIWVTGPIVRRKRVNALWK
ncbi:uncharacterized protein EV154DRAFT_529119 [Mucor mucedo]|uniref:uncharacterized protein n=1 Tax=Mucor mucedo TaxID=29922 RepID=UPI0022211A9F|nr:uncharacterized protein EV154DRAFT_529119 [Mucor mucedo]KAI7872624.1 hypothetical protein EV154DRAFT_529119 [Mucor mucedo]